MSERFTFHFFCVTLTSVLERDVMNLKYRLLASGFLFCALETVYFGCNLYPQSMIEAVYDFISLFIIGVGAFIDL